MTQYTSLVHGAAGAAAGAPGWCRMTQLRTRRDRNRVPSPGMLCGEPQRISVRPRPRAAAAPIKTPAQAAAAGQRSGDAASRTAAKPASALYHPPADAADSRQRRTSLFQYTCGECHNSAELAGGLDVALYSSPDSLTADRDALGVDPREAQVRRDAAA